MTNIDGKVLTFEELIQIPNRIHFLDASKVQECRQLLTSQSPVEFLPVKVEESYLPEKAGVLSQDKYAFRMYKIVMTGILKSGEKITVVLDNVLPFMELRVPRPPDAEFGSEEWSDHTDAFKRRVQAACREQNFKLKETHVVSGATVKEYGDKADFIQLCFSSLGERKKTIEYFDKNGYETTHDDGSCYYRMVSRDTLTPWTGWCTLQGYKLKKNHDFFKTLYTLNIDYRKIQSYKGDVFADSDLREDKTLECNWDIETEDPLQNEEIPQPTSRSFNMPNISMSFAWIDADLCPVNKCVPSDALYDWQRPKGHIIQYNITTMMTPAMPNRTTVICRNMSEMIMAFGLIWRKMQPDYEVGFNSHNYDWLCIAEVARQLKLLEFLERNMSTINLELYRQFEDKPFQTPKTPFAVASAEKSWGGYAYWKRDPIKISAELQNFPTARLNYPGYVGVDLLPQLRAANGNPEKYSLHYFLKNYGLGDKVDMPYREMFARFAGNRRLFDELKRGLGPSADGKNIQFEVAPLEDLHPEAILRKAVEQDVWRHRSGVATRVLYKTYAITGRDVRIEGDQAVAWNMTYHVDGQFIRTIGNTLEVGYATMREAVKAAMQEMVDVAEYCIVDGLRCHDLMYKTQYVKDKREVGKLSFTTMDDCVYRANGMKVRNMIIAKAGQRGYHVSNKPPKKIEQGKYPGAYVFPPKKGVANSKASPHEMRYGTKTCTPRKRWVAWQVMSEADFNRCLDKIADCGIWMEDYLPAPRWNKATGHAEVPTEHPDQEAWDRICKVRHLRFCGQNESYEAFSARYWQQTRAEWLLLYRERYDSAVAAGSVTVSYQEWLDTFAGDLAGEWPAAFVDWLLVESHYPIAGLDFSSLYPSLIMTYNFSPEMMVHSLERAVELKESGKNVHTVNFPFNGRTIKGWSVRHRYPERQSEIDALLKRIQKITRQDDPDSSEEEALLRDLERLLCDTEFGLFPTVLKDLFDQRVALKAQLKPLAHKIEELELLSREEFAKWIQDHAEEYSMIMGKYNYLNSKQKALKVFMNTFYGESGNALSPLRVLALAGGVTTGGQYNIKKVAQLVQDLLCRIYYGDTDSVYISMPRRAFRRYDRAYYSQRGDWAYVLMKREVDKKGETKETWEWLPVDETNGREHRDVGPLSKKAYHECLVTESFRQIKTVNRSVNIALEADNGTQFLNMAFEEFLFPAAFFSKKKYCGIAHEGEFNRNPKKIFVRGLEYVKKGVSEMLKDISKDILWEAFDFDNVDSIDEIVERMIEKIYTERNIDFEKFVKTASYRPNKQNVSVHTFHRRMDALGIAPEPLDRFRYVMVKKYPFKYDMKGRKTELSVGDRMEYADRARALGMEVDLDYYMSSNVCGQLARFISWRDDFHVEPRDDSDEAYNEAEKKNITAASKYIERCYERWSEKHKSKGPALRTLFNKVNGVFHEEFSHVMPVSDIWQVENQTHRDVSDEKNRSQTTYEENQCMFHSIVTNVEKQVHKESRKDAERLISNMPLRGDKALEYAVDKRTSYKNLLATRKAIAARQLPLLHQQLRGKVQMLRRLLTKRDNILEQCISNLSSQVGIADENFDTLEPIIARIHRLDTVSLRMKIGQEISTTVTHQDLLVLGEIDAIYLKLLSINKLVKVTEIVYTELGTYIQSKHGIVKFQEDHLDDIDEWMEDNLDD